MAPMGGAQWGMHSLLITYREKFWNNANFRTFCIMPCSTKIKNANFFDFKTLVTSNMNRQFPSDGVVQILLAFGHPSRPPSGSLSAHTSPAVFKDGNKAVKN